MYLTQGKIFTFTVIIIIFANVSPCLFLKAFPSAWHLFFTCSCLLSIVTVNLGVNAF